MQTPTKVTFNAIEAKAAKAQTAGTIAVAQAHDEAVLAAVADAHRAYGLGALLIGDVDRIASLAPELTASSGVTLEAAATDDDAARQAVSACREGRATMLMKGHLSTSTLMRAVVDRDHGLRGNSLLSHVMLYEVPGYERLLAVTDGGLVPDPDETQKVFIVKNAVTLLRALGYDEVVVALIAGSETVNPRIKATVDAAAIARRPEWAADNVIVYGPVGLDLAVSPEAVRAKRYVAQGAGYADVIVVPTYEVGNGIGKTLTLFAKANAAGLIMGAHVPIVLVSRADVSAAKRRSIALAMVASTHTGGPL